MNGMTWEWLQLPSRLIKPFEVITDGAVRDGTGPGKEVHDFCNYGRGGTLREEMEGVVSGRIGLTFGMDWDEYVSPSHIRKGGASQSASRRPVPGCRRHASTIYVR